MLVRHLFYTLTFFLWNLTIIYPQLTIPQDLINDMASREVRYHHHLWHQVRNLWDRFDADTQAKLAELGWAPPRPAQRYENGSTYPIEDNNAGEDFFYMHRQMKKRANAILHSQTPPQRIVAWTTIPGPGDVDFPVPPAYTVGSEGGDLTRQIANYKSDDFYYNYIQPREARFKDPAYLRTLTLGQLGAKVEFTIHSWIHIRFSEASPVGYRSRSNDDPLPDVDERWDDPNYFWMIDSYASQVSPWFWKVHGWVDDRIDDWMAANGVERLTWNAHWVGGPMDKLPELVETGKSTTMRTLQDEVIYDDEDDGMDCSKHGGGMEIMQKAMEIVRKTGMESHFYDPVIFEEEELQVDKKIKNKSKKRKLRLG